MTFSRSGVIDIDDQITSILCAFSAGMMPSHAVPTISHFSFSAAHTAFIRSTSKPTHLPVAVWLVKGGYGSAAAPNFSTFWAAWLPLPVASSAAAASAPMIVRRFIVSAPLVLSPGPARERPCAGQHTPSRLAWQ